MVGIMISRRGLFVECEREWMRLSELACRLNLPGLKCETLDRRIEEF